MTLQDQYTNLDLSWQEKYVLRHPDKVKKSRSRWARTSRGKKLNYLLHYKYNQTSKGKASKAKTRALRRGLGKSILYCGVQKTIEGPKNYHHVNKFFIIPIPEVLHRSIRHNVRNGQNMIRINRQVLRWIMTFGLRYR